MPPDVTMSDWERRNLEELAVRFFQRPNEVREQLKSGEVHALFRGLRREVWIEELKSLTSKCSGNEDVALAWFLDSDGSRGLRARLAEPHLEQLRSSLTKLDVPSSECTWTSIVSEIESQLSAVCDLLPDHPLILESKCRVDDARRTARTEEIALLRLEAERKGIEHTLNGLSSDEEIEIVRFAILAKRRATRYTLLFFIILVLAVGSAVSLRETPRYNSPVITRHKQKVDNYDLSPTERLGESDYANLQLLSLIEQYKEYVNSAEYYAKAAKEIGPAQSQQSYALIREYDQERQSALEHAKMTRKEIADAIQVIAVSGGKMDESVKNKLRQLGYHL